MSGYRQVIAAFLFCGALFFSPAAFAYEGVIAPPEDAGQEDSTAPKNDGYGGVVAPSDGKIAPSDDDSYAGYTPIPQEPQATPVPGGGLQTPKTVEDLKMLSTIYAHDKDMDGIPDEMDESFRLPPMAAKVLAQPEYRENGMLPREVMTKRMIDMLLKSIKESKTDKERQKLIKMTEDSLRTMQNGLRSQKSIPALIWQKLGVPQSYVKEQEEGNDKSLSRISDALQEIEKYK